MASNSEMRALLGDTSLADLAAFGGGRSLRRRSQPMATQSIVASESPAQPPSPVESPLPTSPPSRPPSGRNSTTNGIKAQTAMSRRASRSSNLTTPPATSPVSSHIGDTTKSEPSPKTLKRKRDSVVEAAKELNSEKVDTARLSIKVRDIAVPATKKRKSTPAAISSPYFGVMKTMPKGQARRRSTATTNREFSDAFDPDFINATSPKPPVVKPARRPRASQKAQVLQPDSMSLPSLTLEQRIEKFNIDPGVLGAVTDDTILLHAAQYQHLSHQKLEDKMEAVAPPTVRSLSADAIADFTGDFRARQRAIDTLKPFMRGALFTGHGLDRDYIGTGVLLSRAGGGMTKDENGVTSYAKSTAADNQTECILMNMKMNRPVLIFIGKDAQHAQFKFPADVNIVLLGWFMPTHTWHEKNGKDLVVRFRFEALQENKAWWRAKPNETGDNQEPARLGDYPPPSEDTCESCGTEHQLTYVQGWCCLNHECSRFWRLSNGAELNSENLAYHPHWLNQRTEFDVISPPYDLCLQPDISPQDFARQISAPSAAARAIRCPRCGYVEARTEWNRWTCPAEDCDFRVEIPAAPISASEVMSWENPIGNGPPHPQIDISSAGTTLGLQNVLSSKFLQGHRVTIIPLDGRGDGPRNFFCHLQANAVVNGEPIFGPDALFRELQRDGFLNDIKRPLSPNTQLAGPTYAGQYSQNYGEFYDYYTKQTTKPFADAPGVVNLARSRMTWGGKFIHKLLADRYGEPNIPALVDFNECLALGYKGEHQMSWHDDGEDSVYGIVGTMALGGEAEFSIRVHKNRYIGYSDKGIFSIHEPIKGCLSDAWRIEHWPEHKARLEAAKGAGEISNVRKQIATELKEHRAEVQKAWKKKDAQLSKIKALLSKDRTNPELRRQEAELAQQVKQEKSKESATPPTLLTFTMRHGDMIWMLGEDMQSWYEHGVFRRFDRYNLPRFAFTFRHILETQKSGKKNEHFHHEPPDPGFYPGPKLD